MKSWEIKNKTKFTSKNFNQDLLQKILLENRGIKTKKDIEYFLNPQIEAITSESLCIDDKELKKAVSRIKKAIKNKEKIVVFGDYDADGVTGAAIIWESLNKLGADIMPYIPHRINEGYGLSKKGIDNLLKLYPESKIIVTVDNGIVAVEAVDYANSLDLDVIITDHHTLGKDRPKALAIVHSTKICGAAVGWFFSRQVADKKIDTKADEHLGLVALATVSDVMKLTEYNRALLVGGLDHLRTTKRPGLVALISIAGIDQNKIGVYEIGHIIGPRLNATGRLEHAMDSLRLLCTKDHKRARELADKLNTINLDRQKITVDSVLHAKSLINGKVKNLLFIAHESYEPGVIGLIAGRLSEEFYRPSIVISQGDEFSKASARSVVGFNIIEFIRLSSHLLVDAGGHPGAAGFTVETSKISELKDLLEKLAEEKITKDLLVRKLSVDCELDLGLVSDLLYESLQKLSPFGNGNSEPTFLTDAVIENMRTVGADQKHLKIEFGAIESGLKIGGVMFNYDKKLNLSIGDKVEIVFTISQNEWKGNKKLELKIRDIKAV